MFLKSTYTRNVHKTAFVATMIKGSLNLWARFKALVVVSYVLYAMGRYSFGKARTLYGIIRGLYGKARTLYGVTRDSHGKDDSVRTLHGVTRDSHGKDDSVRTLHGVTRDSHGKDDSVRTLHGVTRDSHGKDDSVRTLHGVTRDSHGKDDSVRTLHGVTRDSHGKDDSVRTLHGVTRDSHGKDDSVRTLHGVTRDSHGKDDSVRTLNGVIRDLYGKDGKLKFILFILIVITKKNFNLGQLKSASDSIKVACQKSIRVTFEEGSSISTQIFLIIGVAWFGEKMNINIEFYFTDLEDVFESSMLNYSGNIGTQIPRNLNYTDIWGSYAVGAIPSEYGNKIISRLKIKEALLQQADEWVNSNLQGDWVSVHYRGTDATKRSIAIEAYIAYLKEVLDDQCSIFACSDQAQFIDQIKEAFPGRVFSREITRSYDHKPLHRNSIYRGKQQTKDALIDILILSRTNLIYTTGSWFVDVVRFFNPAIKIISFNLIFTHAKYYKKIDNYIPIPKAHLLKIKHIPLYSD